MRLLPAAPPAPASGITPSAGAAILSRWRRRLGRRVAGDALDRALGWALILLLALAPLPLGSNRPVPWTILALATGLLLLVWSVAASLRPAAAAPPPRLVWAAIAGFGLIALLALFQTMPLAPRSWQHPLWLEAAAVLGPEVSGRISVNAFATGTALMRLLTYAGVFWLALQLGGGRGQARRIIGALVAVGVAYAVYGILNYAWSPDTILWWRKWYLASGLTSTFVCRGCYAAYGGLGLLCAAGLLIASIYREPQVPRGWRRPPWRVAVLLAATLCLAAATLLTASRTGVTASALALGALFASLGRSRLMAPRHLQIGIAVTIGLGIAVFSLAGDELSDRFAERQLQSAARFEGFSRIAAAIGDAPWRGTGYGTFGEAFRSHQGPLSGLWTHAHNTYLELAFELGVPATVVLVGAIGALAVHCAQQLRRRRRSALYPALGVAATALIGLDALLDFPPQIPAVAVTFAAILGVGCARAGHAGGARARSRQQRRGRLIATGVAGSLAAGLLVLGVPRLGAELSALPLELAIDQLRAGQTPSPPALDRAIAGGEAALGWTESAETWSQLGLVLKLRGTPPDAPPEVVDAGLARAEQALRRSLALAPASPLTWAQLAEVALRRGGDGAVVSGALAASILSAPNPGQLMVYRSKLAIAGWDLLDARTRSLVPDQIARAMRRWPQALVEAARASGRTELVREILAAEPRLQQRFDRMLRVLGDA